MLNNRSKTADQFIYLTAKTATGNRKTQGYEVSQVKEWCDANQLR